MRILSRKIYRAFPELDQFDDDVCRGYVKRAKRVSNAWKLWFLWLFTVLASLIVWGFFTSMAGFVLFFGHTPSRYDSFFDHPSLVFNVVVWAGYILIPVTACLFIRDDWLHGCIRKQLAGAQCGACGYSLLGLAILVESQRPSVQCPECGHRIALKDMGLTQADIDPTLLSSS